MHTPGACRKGYTSGLRYFNTGVNKCVTYTEQHVCKVQHVWYTVCTWYVVVNMY